MVDETRLAKELRTRNGVTTRVRLRSLGYHDQAIDRLIARGRLTSIGRGVLVDPATSDSLEARVAAACAQTGGVACFPTAGVLWQLRKSPRVAEVHVTVPWSRRVTDVAGITIHRSTCLPEDDVVRRPDGIALTSPPRTVFDAAAMVPAGGRVDD